LRRGQGRRLALQGVTYQVEAITCSVVREQGISKAGNPRARTTMIEMAWLWLR